MSDEKKTISDGAPPPPPAPLKDPKVDVTVNPVRGESGKSDYVEKVKRNLEGDVRDAIKKNADGGSEKQFEKAEQAVKDAATKIDPSKVQSVKVKVRGTVDGVPISDETKAEPTKKG